MTMRRRPRDWELPQIDPTQLGAGQGAADIPYDRTAEEVPPVMPRPGEEQLPDAPIPGGTEETNEPGFPAATPGMEAGPAAGNADLLAGLGGGQPDSSSLSDDDLAGLVQGDPAQFSADQLLQMLQDPNTPPDVKQLIETQLATAARRRMAGMVGGGM